MKKIFLTSFIALGLIACNDSDETTVDKGGALGTNTYASVSVSLKNQTRAFEDSQKDDNGTDLEQKLVALDVLSSAGNKAFTSAASGSADGTFWYANPLYTTAPWATTAGNQKLALLFNKNSLPVGSADAADITIYSDALSGLISPNFTMTSSSFDATVLPSISKDQAAAGTSASENVFTGIEVERVVAKGIVRMASDYSNEVEDAGKKVATISNVTFAAVNGAKRTFLYRDNAGSRTLDATTELYTGFESAIHALPPYEKDTDADAAGLVRLGLYKDDASVSKAKDINAKNIEAKDATSVFYFMENSGDVDGTDMKAKGFYRFAYAKVYATYHPEVVMTIVDKTDETKRTVAPGKTGKFYVKQTDGTYAEATATTVGAIEGTLVWQLKEGTIAEGVTFYKGAEDNVLYDSVDAAASSLTNPGQKVYTYTNGKCGYRALWNRQAVDNTSNPSVVLNASARRNNTYVLDIKSFAKLGFPWDESDPNDPNLPKPDTEDPELPTPTDPNIEPSETYMRVEAKVLPWNLVYRDGIVLQ